MNDTLRQALEAKGASRDYFLKHLEGMREYQWDFKPFAECKSALQTLQHLIIDDQAAVEALRTGVEPDFEAYQPTEGSHEELLQALQASHAELLAEIAARYPNPDEASPICIWGNQHPFRSGVAWLSSEDFYHAGQIAFIRMASDATWDYYGAIYGLSVSNIT